MNIKIFKKYVIYTNILYNFYLHLYQQYTHSCLYPVVQIEKTVKTKQLSYTSHLYIFSHAITDSKSSSMARVVPKRPGSSHRSLQRSLTTQFSSECAFIERRKPIPCPSPSPPKDSLFTYYRQDLIPSFADAPPSHSKENLKY